MKPKKADDLPKETTKPVSYYGKKTYRLHPLLVRVKLLAEKNPDFSGDNLQPKANHIHERSE